MGDRDRDDSDGGAGEPRDPEGSYVGPQHSAPYPMSRLAPAFDLVRTAEEIQTADSFIVAVASAELDTIAQQIRRLQEQAASVLERARRDAELHRAECRFKRRPGQVCHLYERGDGSLYWSLLSPEDWRGAPPHNPRGSYRLETDLRWTPLAEAEARDLQRAQTRRLLSR